MKDKEKGCGKEFSKKIRGRNFNVTCGNYFSFVNKMLLCQNCKNQDNKVLNKFEKVGKENFGVSGRMGK